VIPSNNLPGRLRLLVSIAFPSITSTPSSPHHHHVHSQFTSPHHAAYVDVKPHRRRGQPSLRPCTLFCCKLTPPKQCSRTRRCWTNSSLRASKSRPSLSVLTHVDLYPTDMKNRRITTQNSLVSTRPRTSLLTFPEPHLDEQSSCLCGYLFCTENVSALGWRLSRHLHGAARICSPACDCR
jgi:hypothetical protein